MSVTTRPVHCIFGSSCWFGLCDKPLISVVGIYSNYIMLFGSTSHSVILITVHTSPSGVSSGSLLMSPPSLDTTVEAILSHDSISLH